MYNIIEDLYVNNCTLSGSSLQAFTVDTSAITSPIVLPSGYYIGLNIKSGLELFVNQININANVGLTCSAILYRYSGQNKSSNGIYNTNLGYCTPACSGWAITSSGTLLSKPIYDYATMPMTSATTPIPYQATANNYYSNNRPYYMFTQTTLGAGDFWQSYVPSLSAPANILYSFGTDPACITKYRFQATVAARAPKDWILQGSNIPGVLSSDSINDTRWKTLDIRAGITFSQSYSWSPSFSFSNSIKFSNYRMVITANNGDATYIAIYKLQLTDETLPDLSNIVYVQASSYRNTDPYLYYPWKAFSQTTTNQFDCWASENIPTISGPEHLCIYLKDAKTINKYGIQSANGYSDSPSSWKLSGSNLAHPSMYNESDWNTLDTRSGITFYSYASFWRYFAIDNSTAYTNYRLTVYAAQSSSVVRVGNLKLIEANQSIYSSIFSTSSGIFSFNNSCYSASVNQEILETKIYISNNSGSPLTISGIEVFTNSADYVSLSGMFNPLTFTPDTNLYNVNISNDQLHTAFPKLLLPSVGIYDIDRNISVSLDAPTQVSGAFWYNMNKNSIAIPEQYDWSLGTLSGCQQYRKNLQISDTTLTGVWYSPIFDTDYELTKLVTYTKGNAYPKMEIKSSDTAPPLADFLIVTTENTNEHLMYKHKRVLTDTNGNTRAYVGCYDNIDNGNKIWRMADVGWAGLPLNYHGSINRFGEAAFLCPGTTTCGDTEPSQESTDYTKWYNLCTYTRDKNNWNSGYTISGIEYGPLRSVLYTRTFPLQGSSDFFAASIMTTLEAEKTAKYKTSIHMSYQSGDITRFAYPLVVEYGSRLLPGDTCEVITDAASNGWWAYLGGTINKLYKIDVGSFNSTFIYNGGELQPGPYGQYDNQYYGYEYFVDFQGNYKNLISIPYKEFSGFWAITSSGISLFQEDYSDGIPNMVSRGSINNSATNSSIFTNLLSGACDTFGNLWIIDADQDRLARVNLYNLLNGSNYIDYDNTVDGIVGVLPHPTDGSAYVLTSDEWDHPQQDVIRLVNSIQLPGSRGQYTCTVSGFYSAPYKTGVSFTGFIYSDYYQPCSGDLTWTNTDNNWQLINSNSLTPAGRYKQFKVTFSRNTLGDGGPILEKIRLLKPIHMDPLDNPQSREITVKTDLSNVTTYGSFNTNLLVWWENIDYNG